MAASKNVPLRMETGDRNAAPVAATKRLFQGAMAFLDASGYATPTPGSVFLGHVVAEADNRTGLDGAKIAALHCGCYRAQVTLTGVARTDVGAVVYATADNAYALVGTYGVGKVVRYVSANTAVVEFVAPEITEAGS